MMGYLLAPRVAFGPGALEQLGSLGIRRAALVVDPALLSVERTQRVREALEGAGARVLETVRPHVEPTEAAVEALATQLRAGAPDTIVAVGGGSTIDSAKAAWVRYERPDLALADLTPLTEVGLRAKARLVAVPTTAGSGSEMTGAAYVHTADGSLLEIASRELAPDWTLLDPHFLPSLGPERLALGGFDALAHALEAIASEWSNPFTDALAREAATTLLRELPLAVRHPDDLERLGALQSASAMAGLAVGNAQMGATHALAHALQATFGLAHARAVAPVLPYVLEFNFPSARERYATLQGATGSSAMQNRVAWGQRFRSLATQLGVPSTLRAAGVTAEQFAAQGSLVRDRAFRSPSLVGNPRMPSPDQLGVLLETAFHGGPLPDL